MQMKKTRTKLVNGNLKQTNGLGSWTLLLSQLLLQVIFDA